MIIGINTSYEFQGKSFHIQIEDLGEEKQQLEIRVYHQGSLAWQKRLPYDDAVTSQTDSQERITAIRNQLNKLVAVVKAGIDQGKIK